MASKPDGPKESGILRVAPVKPAPEESSVGISDETSGAGGVSRPVPRSLPDGRWYLARVADDRGDQETVTTISKCCDCPCLREYLENRMDPYCGGVPGDMALSVDPLTSMDPNCPRLGQAMQWRRKGT